MSPQSVAGYLTSDGAFYYAEADARHHEARKQIEEACAAKRVNAERLLALLDDIDLREAIVTYCQTIARFSEIPNAHNGTDLDPAND